MPGVNEELLICLKRKKLERKSLLIVIALDDFLEYEWRSELASYLNDRLVFDFRHAVLASESFAKTGKRLLCAIRYPAKYVPLLYGTWGYFVNNISEGRRLVGAFRIGIESSGSSLVISEGRTYKVDHAATRRRTLWLTWKSTLVAYYERRLGFFYEGTLHAEKREYDRDLRAAWLLAEADDMLSFEGVGYPLGMEHTGSDVLIQAKRLNVRREDGRELHKLIGELVEDVPTAHDA